MTQPATEGTAWRVWFNHRDGGVRFAAFRYRQTARQIKLIEATPAVKAAMGYRTILDPSEIECTTLVDALSRLVMRTHGRIDRAREHLDEMLKELAAVQEALDKASKS